MHVDLMEELQEGQCQMNKKLPVQKQKIITLDARNLFKASEALTEEKDKPFKVDMTDKFTSGMIVKQEAMMETCPLFDQLLMVLEDNGEDNAAADKKSQGMALYDQLLIMDFDDIFLPNIDPADELTEEKKKDWRENTQYLIEYGMDVHFEDYDVHMVAFDKSGNMSRKSRMTFINDKYYHTMNERLNLGIDFSKIKVILSKYYAYRGLYLSSSRRISHSEFKLTSETLVIMKDVRMRKLEKGESKGEFKPVTGLSYERDVPVQTAVETPAGSGNWELTEPELKELQYNDLPFDGEGFVVPEYSRYMNLVLGIQEATSYQIRLPFAKGMLHEVDVQGFIHEFSDGGYEKNGAYLYKDAFDIERDLTKAKIILTESMFKGKKWLKAWCEQLKKLLEYKDTKIDPMQVYCDAIEKYQHGLYVSGTNLPYGHSACTHLSYQIINTLDFSQKQFEHIMDKHCQLIDDPLKFIRKWDALSLKGNANDEVDIASDERDDSALYAQEANGQTDRAKISYVVPNWEKAALRNVDLKNDIYIKNQLKNTQKALLNKLVTGKLVVAGQTRYLCRDLLPLLASLLVNPRDTNEMWPKYLNWSRFFLPVGKIEKKEAGTQSIRYEDASDRYGLDYAKSYAFFRSPHLSRNEQCLLKPLVQTNEDTYNTADHSKNVKFNTYKYYVEGIYTKYFGHLTGIVMVSRSSVAPLCLGGADFDGDLVNIIFDQDVAEAVKSGVYCDETVGLNGKIVNELKRKLPVINIPSTASQEEVVPEHVPYKHIEDTFSNRIGQISNKAIAIGQKEYGHRLRSGKKQSEAAGSAKTAALDKNISCAACTLLTGLEIDSAKNGAHPNLDSILNGTIGRSSYLAFINRFRKLRAESSFRYENMRVEKKQGKSKSEVMVVTAKDCKSKVRFVMEEYGTYINELPASFLHELNETAKKWRKANKAERHKLFYNGADNEKYKEQIEAFGAACSAVMDVYFFYHNIFMPALKAKKNCSGYAEENLEKLIDQMYDQEHAERIKETVKPILQRKLAECMPADMSGKKMMQQINTYQWQFQPMEKRGKTLEKILGEKFHADNLTDEEQRFLYHFKLQGYKILWLLMDVICCSVASFDEMKKRVSGEKEKYILNDTAELDERLESEARAFYEQNAVGIEERIYRQCLEEIKKIIRRTKNLPMSLKVVALYDRTEKDYTQRRFFWDAFSWKKLQPLIEEKKEGAEDVK